MANHNAAPRVVSKLSSLVFLLGPDPSMTQLTVAVSALGKQSEKDSPVASYTSQILLQPCRLAKKVHGNTKQQHNKLAAGGLY